MAIVTKTTTGWQLQCETAQYPRWSERQISVRVREGNDSYRQPTPKRTRPKGVEILFNPTVQYNDSLTINDAPRRVFTSLSSVGCAGSYLVDPIYNRYEVKSAGARRMWTTMGMVEGQNPPTNSMTSYRSFNPTYDKLWAEVKAEKVNLAMMLAEYRQMGSMFSNFAREFVGLYRSIRRGRFRQFVGNRNGPANDWLMYRYGISPLISDINGISDLIMQSGAKPLIRRVSVKHQLRELDRGTSAYGVDNFKWQRLEEQRVRDTVYVEYTQSRLLALSQTGFLNPLALAWEVIPYSFVVDWFFNIGDQLANLDALTGTKRWSGTRAVNYRRTLLAGPSWSATAKRYNRFIINSGPSLSFPRWEPSLTWKRIVDAAALGRQQMR